MSRNSLFKRLYGKSAIEIANEYKINVFCVYDYHRKGLMKKLQITNDAYYGLSKLEFAYIKSTFDLIDYRCNNKNDTKYKYYGGKGIKNELSIQQLSDIFIKTGRNLKRPSIDRIDPNKNYTIENCQFIEFIENALDGLKRGRNTRRNNRNELLKKIDP